MSLKSRVVQAERRAGINQPDDAVAVIILGFASEDDRDTAVICSGTLAGTEVCAHDGEDTDALSERVYRITRGLEPLDGKAPATASKGD